MRSLTKIAAIALLFPGAAVATASHCEGNPFPERAKDADTVLYAYLDSVEATDEPGEYALTFSVVHVKRGEAPKTIVLTTRTRAWIDAPVREWLDDSRQVFNGDVYLLVLRPGQTELGKCDPVTRIIREA